MCNATVMYNYTPPTDNLAHRYEVLLQRYPQNSIENDRCVIKLIKEGI